MISITIPTALALCSIASILYLFSLAIYRLFLSPISHIPGPRLAALTYLYQFYYDVYPHQGQFMFHYITLHKKYGPIIRIGPDEIHINDMAFYNEIYTNNSRRRDKSKLWFWMSGLDDADGRSTFATIEHELHRMRRAAFGQYFSRGKMLELQPRVVEKVVGLRENMMKWTRRQEPLELISAMSALTLEVITEYAFGRAIPVLNKDEMAASYIELLQNGVRMHPVARQFPTLVRSLLTMPEWIMSGNKGFQSYKDHEKAVTECARYAFNKAKREEDEEKKAGGTTVLWEMVNAPGLPPEEKTFARLKNDASIFIGAGMETTGRTLALTFYHILANPEIHTRLREELSTLLPSSSSTIPSLQELEKLPYLTACIEEGLRVSHGTAGRLARTAPDENLTYHGIKIPKGTTMSQSGYLLHMDPTVFTEPEVFRPERFLGDGPGVAEAKRQMVPFGKGTRMCVGLNLAWAELYLTVAVLIATVDLELVGTTARDATVMEEFFLGSLPRDSKGIRVKVVGRRE